MKPFEPTGDEDAGLVCIPCAIEFWPEADETDENALESFLEKHLSCGEVRLLCKDSKGVVYQGERMVRSQ